MQNNRVLEASSLLGIVAGFGLMVPTFFIAELGLLALPGFVLLLPSLLYGLR
jgi:hypothetical protein